MVRKLWRFTFLVSSSLLMVACGPGGQVGGPGGPSPTGPVTRTITPEGGVVRVVNEQGAVLTLTFPAQAVVEILELTASPAEPDLGSQARFEVQPAGVQLKRPVQLRYEPPTGAALSPSSTFYFGAADARTLVPTSADEAAQSLTTSTLFLGYSEPHVSAGLSSLTGGSDFLNIADIECQSALQNLLTRLEYVRNFPFSSSQSGHQLMLEIEATKERCAGNPEAFEAQLATIEQQICQGYRDATADAAVLESDSAETLLKLVGKVLNWEAAKQTVGTDCDGLGGNFLDVIGEEFDEFIVKYRERIDRSDFPTEYQEIWNELRNVSGVWGHTAVLGLDDAEQKALSHLLSPLYDKLRDAAYAQCRRTGEQAYLVDLLWGGRLLRHPLPTSLASGEQLELLAVGNLPGWASFSAGELADDIQFCATNMTLEVFTPLPAKVDALTRTLEGSSTPGGHEMVTASQAPVTGSIVLEGDIKAFRCANPDRLSDDELVIKLNGTEIKRLPRSGSGFLNSRVDLELEPALRQAGIDPTRKASYPLELYREGEACGGLYGDNSFKLFTVEVELDPKPELSSVSASPATLISENVTPVTFTLPFRDQGENVKTLVLVVDLQGDSRRVEVDVTTSASTVGFSGPGGDGRYTVTMNIRCSEKGKNPLRATVQLVDAFDQASETASTNILVNYSPCD